MAQSGFLYAFCILAILFGTFFWQWLLLMWKPRIKALQSVTVHALEKAIEVGFQTLGHRNIKMLCTSLDERGRLQRQNTLQVLLALFQLFLVCKNGLVPGALLEKAGSVDWKKKCKHRMTTDARFFFPAHMIDMFTASRRWNPHMLARSSSWMTSWSWIGASVFCRWKYDNWLASWELSRRIPACGKHVTRSFPFVKKKKLCLCWMFLRLSRRVLHPSSLWTKISKMIAKRHGGKLFCGAHRINMETTCRMLQWQSTLRRLGLTKQGFSRFVFSFVFFGFFQVDFTSLLQGPGGFLDLAVEHACSAAAAACAAAAAASRTFPAPAKKKSYSVAGSPEKPKKKKQKIQSPEGQCVEKWWKPDFQKDPLQDFWDKDVAKGLNMTPKCFASRIYHKIDKNSRTRAKKAHAAAMQFALGQSEWMGLVYRCLIGGFWDAHASLMGFFTGLVAICAQMDAARWYGWKKESWKAYVCAVLDTFFPAAPA